MRVLLINDYSVITGGTERTLLMLRDGLRGRGHDVRIFASRGMRSALWSQESFADATCMSSEGRLQAMSSVWNVSARKRLREELESFSPDVVHVTMFLWQLSPAIQSLLQDVPTVFHMMTYKAVCPSGMKQWPDGKVCAVQPGIACLQHGCVSPLRWIPMMQQLRLFRRWRHVFDCVLVPSRAVQEICDTAGLGDSEVLPNGCEAVDARPELRDPPVVGFAGRLSKEKGIDTLIRAFEASACPDPAELWIAGDGPEEAGLRALAQASSKRDCIRFLGSIEYAELNAVFAPVWVQAVPSTWVEPFGLVTIEAMMRGTAVIASDLGGMKETVINRETGLLLPPGEDEAWAEAIAQLLSDREACERMGGRGRQIAREKFDIETHVDALESLLHELAEGGRSA